jgi:hypothetical protein
MQDFALAVTGLAILALTGFSFYKVVPGEQGQTIPWMRSENIATLVTISLIVSGLTGLGLVIRSFA